MPTFEVELHTRQKLCHFGHCVAKTELFCHKSFIVVIQPLVAAPRCKKQDLGNRARLLHQNKNNFPPYASHLTSVSPMPQKYKKNIFDLFCFTQPMDIKITPSITDTCTHEMGCCFIQRVEFLSDHLTLPYYCQ